MRRFSIIISTFAILLSGCNQSYSILTDRVFSFDTWVRFNLYEGNEQNVKEVKDIIKSIDKLTDNYSQRDVNNVYTINNTNDEVFIGERLYELLKFVSEFDGADYYNYLVGSLSKKWKESLANNVVLDDKTIQTELDKIEKTHLTFSYDYTIQRTGEAEIDLGGVAKGFLLDELKTYFRQNSIEHYLVDAGSSSILLGKKMTNDGLFEVDLKNLPGHYLKLSNCFISTSGISEQGVKIGDITYSHIVNPKTGSTINKHDTVIVISKTGVNGDIFSTSFMMSDISEIQAVEQKYGLETIVIDNGDVSYSHPNIKVYKR